MTFLLPFFRPSAPAPEVPAIARSSWAGDVLANRPVFKAPPLEVEPPIEEIQRLTAEFQNRLSPLR